MKYLGVAWITPAEPDLARNRSDQRSHDVDDCEDTEPHIENGTHLLHVLDVVLDPFLKILALCAGSLHLPIASDSWSN